MNYANAINPKRRKTDTGGIIAPAAENAASSIALPQSNTKSPYDKNSDSYGIRSEFVGAGLSDKNIGWDGEYVTYKGRRTIAPKTNINGTTFAPRGDIQRAINGIYESEGDGLVQLNQYGAQNGMQGLIGYNSATRQATVDGKPINYAYIDDSGNAWVKKSDADRAFSAAGERQGVKNPELYLAAYDSLIKKAQGNITGAVSDIKNWKMGDLQKDTAYKAYRDAYLREAARAYANGIGQAAAANGGNLSSAAIAAAGQNQRYYLSQLDDVIPQIESMAYQRAVNAANTQIEAERQAITNAENLYAKQYTKNRDAVDDSNKVREDAYQRLERAREKNQSNIENALSNGMARGSFTPEETRTLNLPEGTSPYLAEALYKNYIWDNAERRQTEEKTNIDTQAQKDIENNAHQNNLEVLARQYANESALNSMNFQNEMAKLGAQQNFEREQNAISNQLALAKLGGNTASGGDDLFETALDNVIKGKIDPDMLLGIGMYTGKNMQEVQALIDALNGVQQTGSSISQTTPGKGVSEGRKTAQEDAMKKYINKQMNKD